MRSLKARLMILSPDILTKQKGILQEARVLNNRAQSIIEYVMLFVIVAVAITVTNKYISRSMNARLKQVQEELYYMNDR